MTCLRYPYHGNGLFSLMWCWTQFGQDGPVVRITAESAANAAGYKNFRSWEFLDVVISVTWKFREEGPELFRLGVCIRSVWEPGIPYLARLRTELWCRPAWTVRKLCFTRGSDPGGRSQRFQTDSRC